VADATQLTVEQEYFDHAAECRERSRATLIAAPASAAGPIAGGSAVKRVADEYLARMPGPDEAVAIGRFETEDETLYVGKRRISDDDGEPPGHQLAGQSSCTVLQGDGRRADRRAKEA
jgi:hypothetical protein